MTDKGKARQIIAGWPRGRSSMSITPRRLELRKLHFWWVTTDWPVADRPKWTFEQTAIEAYELELERKYHEDQARMVNFFRASRAANAAGEEETHTFLKLWTGL